MDAMTFLKVLLSCNLILIVATFDIFVDKNVSVLLNTTLLQHYNVKFVPYVEDKSFYGESEIFIYIANATQNINFLSENLAIIDIELSHNNQTSEFYMKEKIYTPTKYWYHYETHIMNIQFENTLLSGNYIMNVKFTGNIADNGGFKAYYTGNHGFRPEHELMLVSSTHLEAAAVQRLLPCWNITLTTTFNISIKHSGNNQVFSNMAIREVNKKNNKSWTHFYTTYQIPIYSVKAAMTNFSLIRDKSITIWCRRKILSDVKYAFSITELVIEFLQYGKILKKYIKNIEMNYIAIPNFQNNDQMNLEVNLYNEADIISNYKKDPYWRRIEIKRLIGRKVLYDWISIMFPTHHNKLSYLKKGFALVFGGYILDQAAKDFPMQDLFVVQILHDCLRLGTNNNNWPPISKVNNSIEIEIPHYIKASIIFRMFLREFAPEIVWHNMRINSYLTDFDFWTAFKMKINRDTYNDNFFNSHYDKYLEVQVESLTEEKYFPVIKVIRDYTIRININKTIVKIFVVKHSLLANQIIHITATTQTHCNFNRTMYTTWINASQDSNIHTIGYLMNGEEPGWIILNLQQYDMYRVNYDDENWQRIASYLNSIDYYKIHVLNRAQIIDDSYYFLMSGNLSLSIFLQLISYLSQEKEYIAWFPMFKALEDMSRFLPFQDHTYFKANIIIILSKISENIHYPQFNATISPYDRNLYHYELLQEGIARWACIFDSPECLKAAKNNLEWYIKTYESKNENEASIWPGWTDWTFCNGLKVENYRNFYALSVTNLIEHDIYVVRNLVCYKNIDITLTTIEVKHTLKIVKNTDIVNMFCSTIARQIKISSTLDHVLEKFEELKPKHVSTFVMFIIMINNMYSEEQLEKIKKFGTNLLLDKNEHNGSILDELNNLNENYIKEISKLQYSAESKKETNNVIILSFIKNKIDIRSREIQTLKDYYKYLKSEILE